MINLRPVIINTVFKKNQHSTVHCTFVLKEVIENDLNNSTDVYIVLLDANRTFDSVNYVKLFTLFIKHHLSPTVARFLANIYTSQCIRVKWDDFISDHVPVVNGVKQGRVLSPIVFIIYLDERLRKLSLCDVGCYVGNMYYGSFGYADDAILLVPTLYSVKKLLCICEAFAKDDDDDDD